MQSKIATLSSEFHSFNRLYSFLCAQTSTIYVRHPKINRFSGKIESPKLINFRDIRF